jgi:acetolactate synthase-1/2/3 large subunit
MLDREKYNGADQLIACFKEHNVDVIFCISGAGNLAVIDAIMREGSIQLIYSHHEQAAVMEAQGYSRISGKPGVVLVTTGGGAANTLTGILSAYLDSVPVIVISGNESSFHCENHSNLRAYGVQGFDSVEVMKPVTKFAVRIKDVSRIKSEFDLAWNSSISGRMGPSFVDFPLDLQRRKVDIAATDSVSLKTNYNLLQSGKEIAKTEIEALRRDVASAERPLLYLGNGCRGTNELAKLQEIISVLEIPFCLSWSAADLLPSDHKLNMGRIGIYGDRAANILLQKADLIICLGTRLAIPQIGYDKSDFGRSATKWIIEIDPTECDKFKDTNWHILNCSTLDFLLRTNLVDISTTNKKKWREWIDDINQIWTKLPRLAQVGPTPHESYDVVHSAQVIDYLNTVLDDNAVVVTDVGAGLLSGHYAFAPRSKQRLFTSQGLGEMGFGLPGAIGAHFAAPNRQLVCLNTDGGIMFNLQELQVVREHRIPLKLFIFNNDGYSMIKISQQNLFEGRMSGSGVDSGISFPSFEIIAEAFGLQYVRIENESDMHDKLPLLLQNSAPVLVEILMSPSQKYLPRLSTSKQEDGTLVSPPLEDLDPLLPLNELEKFLGYQAHENSYRARGIPYAKK